VASREGGLSFPPDDMVCGWHILGDVLGQTERWRELVMGTR
jgi:hypothetical protein